MSRTIALPSSCSPMTPSERELLADLLFPDGAALPTMAGLQEQYPARQLPPGALVTRFAPSPTGFAHIGAIYTSLLNAFLSRQSGGVFILRIEDTDSKREVEGAFDAIVDALALFRISPDEGPRRDEDGIVREHGEYGPYIQSKRREAYRGLVRELVLKGLAYPCFATEGELMEMSEVQRLQRVRPGYYGTWAKWRDASLEKIEVALAENLPYVLRLRSWGCYEERDVWEDILHGKVSMPQNDLDAVILKSDGSSLYHLAHVVDDHFMEITHVIRGDEWLSSVPLHRQIFAAFGWEAPRYAHFAPVQKLESNEEGMTSRRKLSKRKDPEANVHYYWEKGYPVEAVIEYLLNLLNSACEDWRKQNPTAEIETFPVKLEKVSRSGALVDLDKLAHVGRDVVSRMSLDDVYGQGLRWARKHDPELATLMVAHLEVTRASLNIERGGTKPSKRIGSWSDLKGQLEWFYDELFRGGNLASLRDRWDESTLRQVLDSFVAKYDPEDTKEAWFAKCQEIAVSLGFSPSVKEFKADPGKYLGHVGDITMIIRLALSGKTQTPDLWECMRVLGRERVTKRLSSCSF